MSVYNGCIQVLLVEDNPGDVRLTKEALKEGKLLNQLTVVGDGWRRCHFSARREDMPTHFNRN